MSNAATKKPAHEVILDRLQNAIMIRRDFDEGNRRHDTTRELLGILMEMNIPMKHHITVISRLRYFADYAASENDTDIQREVSAAADKIGN